MENSNTCPNENFPNFAPEDHPLLENWLDRFGSWREYAPDAKKQNLGKSSVVAEGLVKSTSKDTLWIAPGNVFWKTSSPCRNYWLRCSANVLPRKASKPENEEIITPDNIKYRVTAATVKLKLNLKLKRLQESISGTYFACQIIVEYNSTETL